MNESLLTQGKERPLEQYRPFAVWPWIQVGVVTAVIVVLFGGVWVDMAHDWWTQPELSQGMLLPPLALLIAWIERDRVLAHAAKTDYRGLILTAMACAAFVLGNLASEDFLRRFSFVVLLTGIIWTFWGLKRLQALAFPLLLLAVMVPLPSVLYNTLAAPLQLLASDMGSQIAQAFGVSVFRDGNIIQLAGTYLGVAEACSGLSCLSALLVGSLLLGYLMCSRTLSRVILLLSAIPFAILINVLRVAGTALIAEYDLQYATGFYHLFSGWLVFVAGSAVLYVTARLAHAVIDPRQSS